MRVKKLAAPAVYAAGLCALMLCDLVVSSSLGVADVAYWSRVRASTGILAIVCLLGLEQYLLRFPEQMEDVRRVLKIQIPLLSGVCAAFVGITDFLHPWYLVLLIAITVSVSAAMSQFYRGRMMLLASQICQQGWKISLLAGVAFYSMNRDLASFPYLIGLSVGAALLSLWGTNISYTKFLSASVQEPSRKLSGLPLPKMYATSLKLAAISSFTALSLYGEQIIVNSIETDFTAALYFSHATYFLFISSFVYGYLGFSLVPWARLNPNRFIAMHESSFSKYICISILFVFVMQLFSLFLWSIFSPSVGDVDLVLFYIFLTSSFFRLIYTYPSSYIAAFGTEEIYNTMVVLQLLSIFVGLLIFYCLWNWAGVEAAYAVAAGSSCNWALRTVFSFAIIRPSLRGRASSTRVR